MIKFLIGGSPCTHWSIAQSEARETEPEGIGWELFKNYLIAKEKFSPDFFLYENNKSASQPIKERISVELGVPLQYINSALVSAQNRWRFYAHNIGDVPQPEDRGIMLIDILESVTGSEITPVYPFGDFDGKSYCLTSNYHKGSTIKQTLGHHKRTLAAERIELPAYDGRVVGRRINAEGHRDDYNHDLPHIQRFEVNKECCRLQTMPDNYCRAVSDSRAYMGLGNGWTAEVIMHILSHALTGVPKDEEILVLSMYDGIGTGRYCFDKLGYKNVRYFATEIDKYAMQISESNYPDIVQCGDAFSVRESGWRLPL